MRADQEQDAETDEDLNRAGEAGLRLERSPVARELRFRAACGEPIEEGERFLALDADLAGLCQERLSV
jgi:hypothetical protein